MLQEVNANGSSIYIYIYICIYIYIYTCALANGYKGYTGKHENVTFLQANNNRDAQRDRRRLPTESLGQISCFI